MAMCFQTARRYIAEFEDDRIDRPIGALSFRVDFAALRAVAPANSARQRIDFREDRETFLKPIITVS
jgi:hypothetical protein